MSAWELQLCVWGELASSGLVSGENCPLCSSNPHVHSLLETQSERGLVTRVNQTQDRLWSSLFTSTLSAHWKYIKSENVQDIKYRRHRYRDVFEKNKHPNDFIEFCERNVSQQSWVFAGFLVL